MLSSIHPFGERSRNSTWAVTVTAYIAASTIGGAVTGLSFGAVGQLGLTWVSPEAALVTLGVAAAAGALVDAGTVGLRPPGPQRQVNERWLMAYRGWVYGVGFGFQLGLGLATIVTTMTVWLTWLTAALTGSWLQGLVIGAVFGCGRALVILEARSVQSPDSLRTLHRRIAEQAGSVRHMTTITASLTSVTALTLGGLS